VLLGAVAVRLRCPAEVASYPLIFQAAVSVQAAALKAHPLDEAVQEPALFAVYYVCSFGLEGTPGVPALLDAIPPVMAALRAFPTDLFVQEYGCESLHEMCKMDASVAEAVAAAGAMGLFIKALNLVITDNSTPLAAVDAIGAIALSAAALPQSTTSIDAVLRALRRHENNELLAEAACKTLGIYLRCPATRKRAQRVGADYAVCTVAQIHSTNAAVQMAVKDALKAPQA